MSLNKIRMASAAVRLVLAVAPTPPSPSEGMLGSNLDELNDYTGAAPLNDLMKQTRHWITGVDGGDFSTGEEGTLVLDAQGYVH